MKTQLNKIALIITIGLFSQITVAAESSDAAAGYSEFQMLALNMTGKPPHRNRAKIMKQRRAEKVELSALEISDVNEAGKTTLGKRKFGHPDFSKRR